VSCSGLAGLVDLRKIISVCGSSLTLCFLLIIAGMITPAGTGTFNDWSGKNVLFLQIITGIDL
jgi:membrane-bound metal-dependent hydrolase YbcI (DUF457 family)